MTSAEIINPPGFYGSITSPRDKVKSGGISIKYSLPEKEYTRKPEKLATCNRTVFIIALYTILNEYGVCSYPSNFIFEDPEGIIFENLLIKGFDTDLVQDKSDSNPVIITSDYGCKYTIPPITIIEKQFKPARIPIYIPDNITNDLFNSRKCGMGFKQKQFYEIILKDTINLACGKDSIIIKQLITYPSFHKVNVLRNPDRRTKTFHKIRLLCLSCGVFDHTEKNTITKLLKDNIMRRKDQEHIFSLEEHAPAPTLTSKSDAEDIVAGLKDYYTTNIRGPVPISTGNKRPTAYGNFYEQLAINFPTMFNRELNYNTMLRGYYLMGIDMANTKTFFITSDLYEFVTKHLMKDSFDNKLLFGNKPVDVEDERYKYQERMAAEEVKKSLRQFGIKS